MLAPSQSIGGGAAPSSYAYAVLCPIVRVSKTIPNISKQSLNIQVLWILNFLFNRSYYGYTCT